MVIRMKSARFLTRARNRRELHRTTGYDATTESLRGKVGVAGLRLLIGR